MRRHDKRNKSRQEWEADMLECLEQAHRHLMDAKGEQRHAAVVSYRSVLTQFNELLLDGKIPPEEPCYQ